jgi:VRR-NUC domain
VSVTKLKLKAYVPPEQEDQKALVAWARTYCRLPGIDMLYSVPNQVPLHGPLRFAIVNWLKAMGLKNGVPDLVLACARGSWFGLYLETKRRGHTESDLTDEQKTWRKRLLDEGYQWRDWERFEEGKAIIEEYLSLPKTVAIHHLMDVEDLKKLR